MTRRKEPLPKEPRKEPPPPYPVIDLTDDSDSDDEFDDVTGRQNRNQFRNQFPPMRPENEAKLFEYYLVLHGGGSARPIKLDTTTTITNERLRAFCGTRDINKISG